MSITRTELANHIEAAFATGPATRDSLLAYATSSHARPELITVGGWNGAAAVAVAGHRDAGGPAAGDGTRLLPGETEVAGLLALMLLTDARRAARTDAKGSIVPLAEQHRHLWGATGIAEGIALLTATLGTSPVEPCQLQAAIAAVHDEAPTAEETDWPQILALYEVLATVVPGPVVTLSHAVALAMVRGPKPGSPYSAPWTCGLVTRIVSVTDRRAFQVSITDAGRQLVEQIAAQFTERIETFVAGLLGTDRQLLSQLATQIVTADADRHGIDLRTAAG